MVFYTRTLLRTPQGLNNDVIFRYNTLNVYFSKKFEHAAKHQADRIEAERGPTPWLVLLPSLGRVMVSLLSPLERAT